MADNHVRHLNFRDVKLKKKKEYLCFRNDDIWGLNKIQRNLSIWECRQSMYKKWPKKRDQAQKIVFLFSSTPGWVPFPSTTSFQLLSDSHRSFSSLSFPSILMSFLTPITTSWKGGRPLRVLPSKKPFFFLLVSIEFSSLIGQIL